MTTHPDSALDDQRLQADIAALRTRFADTRELYCEVCALLFFRYGITPTANKLYSLVRKGSMTTPADVLNRFWQDLRDKTRVKIDHPDLPDAMKQVAADAVLSIWQAASEAATGQLATLRAEARHQAHEAEAVRDQVVAELELARQATAATQAELEATRAQLASMRDALATEREAHAATEARLQEIRRQVDEAAPQFAQVKGEFTAELERARDRVTTAEERAVSHEKRALREIDQERTARQKSEKTAESCAFNWAVHALN
ncbi:DNA-binding protein [Paraburkholderia sp. UYCP14C]|uniref:DNA-binding protein n=1 Tax=Paraburkholderia sp. UYCP14C TaxID=2511130 RepID=UPI0020071002|nr:DNA-binding protein [Paraburkholderia sp. UYCP14C]